MFDNEGSAIVVPGGDSPGAKASLNIAWCSTLVV